MTALQQFALIDILTANWDNIRVRMGDVPPALASQFAALGRKLAEPTVQDLPRLIDQLLALTRETPAAAYMRELVGRASLGPQSVNREGSFDKVSVAFDVDTAFETIDLTKTNTDSLGAALSGTSPTIGVKPVPVFFATNRQASGPSGTIFKGEPAAELNLGIARVTVPVGEHKLGNVETPSWWNLFADPNNQQKYFTLDVDSLKPTDFSTSLAKAVQTAQSRQLLVFLHGYNVTFEEAAMRAAQFAYDTNFPGLVVLFSWPSQGGISGYTADEARAEASGEFLAKFLQSLIGGPWQQFHMLAHSMGNRVMLSALADNPAPSLPFGEIVFAAADIYVPLFTPKFAKLQGQINAHATSYSSKKDRALWFSSLLHRGRRVGLIEDIPFVVAGLEAIDATSVDSGLLGHGYWSADRALITDIRTLLLNRLWAKDRGLSSVGPYWCFPA